MLIEYNRLAVLQRPAIAFAENTLAAETAAGMGVFGDGGVLILKPDV